MWKGLQLAHHFRHIHDVDVDEQDVHCELFGLNYVLSYQLDVAFQENVEHKALMLHCNCYDTPLKLRL